MQQRIDIRESSPMIGSAAQTDGLLADEDVLFAMAGWLAEGQRAALVTLVSIEGGAPRHPGAQMAVAEDGRYAGYLSGGCLEQAVVLEAQDVIAKGENRMVRYGKGSPYFDIRLPCGSGLDVYFDQAISLEHLAVLALHRSQRRTALIRTDLSTGESAVVPVPEEMAIEASRRDGGVFQRVYAPCVRLQLVGAGPGLVGIATLAAAVGIELVVRTGDEPTRAALAAMGQSTVGVVGPDLEIGALDAASAAVLVFHDHEQEIDILASLLRTRCFYIGVLGNHAVHRARRAALVARGLSDEHCDRIRAPVGTIPGAKSKATLAAGVLAELLAEAKARNLIP